MDRKEFLQAVKANSVRGAYLFEGVEENIKASALAALRGQLLPEGLEELNENLMDNPSTDALIAATKGDRATAEKTFEESKKIVDELNARREAALSEKGNEL